jgi:hypothetical protein
LARDSWIERTVSLNPNQVQVVEADHNRPMNTFVVKNLSNAVVYASLKPTLNPVDYEVLVNPGDYGMIVRPHDYEQVYLVSAAAVSVTVYLVKTENPIILLPSMVRPVGANNVAVVATVGLQPAHLNIDVNKNLGVNVINEIDLRGVSARKITAAGAGDEVVKATAGKVYAVRAGTGVTLTLKDGATEKWHIAAASKDEFSQPVACSTNITLNFSAAGDAWIIYK